MHKVAAALAALLGLTLVPTLAEASPKPRAASDAAGLSSAPSLVDSAGPAANPADGGASAASSPVAPESALDAVLAKKVSKIEGADHRCGDAQGGFAFNSQTRRVWQTGDSSDIGIELAVKSLSLDKDSVSAQAAIDDLIGYAFSGSWSELTVKLSGGGEEETFKISCK